MFKSQKAHYELLPSSSAETSPQASRIQLPSSLPTSTAKKLTICLPPRRYLIFSSITILSILALISLFNPFSSSPTISSGQSLSSTNSPSSFKGDSNLPPPLSTVAQIDQTLSEEQCRKEFPAFVDQIELNKRIWIERGGISLVDVDRAEREADKGWGFARVSSKVMKRNSGMSEIIKLEGVYSHRR